MLSIGICDNEQNCRDILLEYCGRVEEELEEEFTYQLFSAGEEVLAYDKCIDILLLDIEMDGADGIETMKALENHDNIKNIIFVSGYSSRVFESFGLKTRGFICKPVEYDRFCREMAEIVRRNKNSEVFEIIGVHGMPYVVSSDIILIEADGKYVKIVTKEKEITICGSLKEWKLKLEKCNIIQIHKSYLVNLDYISDVKDMVILDSVKKTLPIGRSYRDFTKLKYKEYTLRKFREKINGR